MEQPELPLTASGMLSCGFAEDAYQAAQTIIEFRGQDALIYIALRQFDDFQDEIDRAYWVEVRRACKYIQATQNWLKGNHWRFPMMGK